MKTTIYILSLVIWVGLLLSFTYCNKQKNQSGRDSTNAAESKKVEQPKKKWRIPTEYQPTNNTTARKKKKRDRDSIRNERTNSSNDGIDFNSTRNRNATTATSGTRPGSTGMQSVKPAPVPKTHSVEPE